MYQFIEFVSSMFILRDIHALRVTSRSGDRNYANYWLVQTLAWAVKHDIPFDEAVQTLRNVRRRGNTVPASVRSPLYGGAIFSHLKRGSTLADALKHTDLPLYCVRMIKDAEKEELLHVVLPALAEQMKYQASSMQNLRKLMTYPMVVFTMGFLLILALYIFIIPKFVRTVQDIGMVELPMSFQHVHGVLSWMMSNFIIVIGIIILAWLGSRAMRRRVQTISASREWFMLALPVLGRLYWRIKLQELALSLITALRTGRDIVAAVEWSRQVVTSPRMRRRLDGFIERVHRGEPWHDAWMTMRIGGPLEDWMVVNGAAREDPQSGFTLLADSLDEKIRQTSFLILRLGEPLKIVLVSIVFGYVAFALLNLLSAMIAGVTEHL